MATYDYHKLTVLAPYSLDSLLPLEIMDSVSAVKGSFIERYAIDKLSSEWLDACGFYILFSHIRDDGSFDAYVGKASNGFHRRLKAHDEEKDFWRVALLIRRGTTEGFTTTESLYLEGRMRQVLDSSPNVQVHNIAPTGDKTLPEHDRREMENIILSALRMMFLRGYRNSSMGFIADRITADEIQGFEPARSIPTHPIDETYPVNQPSVSESFSEGKDASADEPEDRFSALRTWRWDRALALGWPPFRVFSNADLTAIAEANPKTLDELATVSGVGPKKLADYGMEVLTVLAEQG